MHGADRDEPTFHLLTACSALRATLPRASRLQRHGAGRRIDFADADSELLADAIAVEICKRAGDYRNVEADGASLAAAVIAELI